jgi:hypothetical protein
LRGLRRGWDLVLAEKDWVTAGLSVGFSVGFLVKLLCIEVNSSVKVLKQWSPETQVSRNQVYIFLDLNPDHNVQMLENAD